MKLFSCIGLLFFFNLAHVFAQEETELLKKVKAKLDKVKDYQAEAKLKMDVSFIDAPESKVTVYYKSPDRFKVKKSGGISILPKGSVSINAAGLLANQDYDIVPGKDATINGVNMKVLKLLPTDENSDVVLTTLYIEEQKQVIRKATVTTKENGTYEIEMSYGKYLDWGLPDKLVFSFNTKDYRLPKGLTFEYEKGTKKKPETIKNKKGKIELNYSSYTINKGLDDKLFAKEN
jgi:outer membrane lipoprotein-sorting protein